MTMFEPSAAEEFEAAKHEIAKHIPALLGFVSKDEAREVLCYLLEEVTESSDSM